MADWYPFATRDQGNSAGPYTDQGEPKGLLHTTEGKSYAGARGAYVANNSWPHFTCSHERGFFQCWQHNPLSLASRALKNLAGGTQTNTDNVVQIELVGTADIRNRNSWGEQYVENFPIGYLNGIRALMRWIELNHGVPRVCPLVWKSYPSSSGLSNGIRLSNTAWDNYSGWLGHQHAAENTHGDPGLINIAYLLDAPNVPVGKNTEDDINMQILVKGTNYPYYYMVDGNSKRQLEGYDEADEAVDTILSTQIFINTNVRAPQGMAPIQLIAAKNKALKEDGRMHWEPFLWPQRVVDDLKVL